MATLGKPSRRLEDFRTDLINEQMNAATPEAQAMAFRAVAGAAGESPLRNVHATGVGVRGNVDHPGSQDFVIKVYVFDKADVQTAAGEPILSRPLQGVEVDVEHLPIQVAFAKSKRSKAAKRPAAGNPGQHQQRRRPVPGGVEIGPLAVTSSGRSVASSAADPGTAVPSSC